MTHPLRAYRLSKKPRLSQQELADVLGFDRVTINRWETGKRLPAEDALKIISKKIGIAASDLRPDLAELLGD